MKTGYVYILSNSKREVLYIGVTGNLERRILRHKSGFGSEFTQKYKLNTLLYYEQIHGMKNAISREKQLKNWHRDWKWNLISNENPELLDLAEDWFTLDEIHEFKLMMENKFAGRF